MDSCQLPLSDGKKWEMCCAVLVDVVYTGRFRGLGKLLGVYTYEVFFPRAGRIDLPTYTLCNRRVTDVGCVSYMQS